MHCLTIPDSDVTLGRLSDRKVRLNGFVFLRGVNRFFFFMILSYGPRKGEEKIFFPLFICITE